MTDEMRFIFVKLSVHMDGSLVFFKVLITDVLSVIRLNVVIDLFEVILVVVRVCVLHFILSRLLI
jgi:hypothetical protein